jgi:hypothetical protein
MTNKRKPAGYWTKERIIADAKRFKTKTEWKLHSYGAVTAARKLNIHTECTAHMEILQGKWTLEALINDAKKYSTPSEWKKKSQSAYATAVHKKYLNKCINHMDRLRKPSGYWTKNKCLNSAKKYFTIQEWSLSDGAAYDAAKRNKWMTEATKHMLKVVSHGEMTIYRYLLQRDLDFELQKRFDNLIDKSYLPYDFYLPDFNLLIEYQGRQHFKVSKSSMFKKDFDAMQRRDQLKRDYAQQNNINLLEIASQIVQEIEDEITSCIKEINPDADFKIRELTNDEIKKIKKLGYWDKESVIAEAKKYKTLTEWMYCGNASQQIARKNGWFKEASIHLKRKNLPKDYWTEEKLIESAKKYTSRKEWNSFEASAYQTAHRLNLFDVVAPHMPINKSRIDSKPAGYWTKERIIENAKEFNTIKEWRQSKVNGYRYAKERGAWEEATAHMKQLQTLPGTWTKERIFQEAKKYSSKAEWRLTSRNSYRAAQKKGFLKQALDLQK